MITLLQVVVSVITILVSVLALFFAAMAALFVLEIVLGFICNLLDKRQGKK